MTPQEKEELERSALLFHVALVQIGAKSMQDSLSLWEDVPPLPNQKGARATTAWLATTVRYVMQRRLRARDLALAYYRYQRGLATGATIAMPGDANPPEYTSLSELKREFEAMLNPIGVSAVEAVEDPSSTEETQEVSEAAETPANESDEDEIARLEAEEEADDAEADRILVEILEGLEEEMAEAERQAEEEIERALQALGPNNMDRKTSAIESTLPAEEADNERQKAHREAGNRQAATVARESMNGARGSLYGLGKNDIRVLGYVRVSRTGTPCGFCAMLISRGFVENPLKPNASSLFRGAQGSSADVAYGDLDLYHDNCQCYAIPVFDAEMLDSDQFALNREYGRLWPIVTQGYGGKTALTKWRRYFRQQAKSQAQVAAA